MGKSHNESIKQIIKSHYNNFTEAEKEIAQFFLENDEVMDFSAKSVVGKLYVSNATLSRFAQKCGFKGYREFIYHYEQSFSAKEDNEGDNLKIFVDGYQRMLKKFYELVDVTQIIRIVKYISDAEQIYIFGKGSSGFAASEMELRFMRIGVDITAIVDPDRMKIQVVFLDKRKLVFGLSVGGKSADVLDGLKVAHLQGAKTVLVTANDNVSFHEYCDEVLLFPKIGNLNGENAISPQMPCLLMIDLLYLYFFEEDKRAKEDLHNKTVWSVTKKSRSIEDQRKVWE